MPVVAPIPRVASHLWQGCRLDRRLTAAPQLGLVVCVPSRAALSRSLAPGRQRPKQISMSLTPRRQRLVQRESALIR